MSNMTKERDELKLLLKLKDERLEEMEELKKQFNVLEYKFNLQTKDHAGLASELHEIKEKYNVAMSDNKAKDTAIEFLKTTNESVIKELGAGARFIQASEMKTDPQVKEIYKPVGEKS